MMRKKRAIRKSPNVAEEHYFLTNDGQVLKNLSELPPALRRMSKETFAHHVNAERNDFANWINDVLGKKKFAQFVSKLGSKTAIIRAMKKKRPTRKRLPDVAEEHKFVVNDGQVLKNLSQLPAALRKMPQYAFAHHVNAERNDFGNWIKDVIGDEELAQTVSKLNSKTTISRAVQAKLRWRF